MFELLTRQINCHSHYLLRTTHRSCVSLCQKRTGEEAVTVFPMDKEKSIHHVISWYLSVVILFMQQRRQLLRHMRQKELRSLSLFGEQLYSAVNSDGLAQKDFISSSCKALILKGSTWQPVYSCSYNRVQRMED